MGFDAGALIFKIQTAGAQLFQRDMDQADRSIRKVEGSAKQAKPALEGQGKATDDVAAKSRKASEEQKKQAQATENQIQAAKGLSLALIASGAAVSALVGLSIAKFTSFDAQMSNTRAATMATAEEQRILGDAALEAGADTAYSANEAAAAEEELAKAGLNVSNIVGGALTGSLALAAAGQLQVARSAEIMATTLKQFKLPASEAASVSDLLAAGAGKAQGSVDDLANALKFVGPVASGLGLSLEETTGILALFAEQGILGEQAGTSLRGVLSSLTSPSKIAADTMKQYGIEIFNANGSMKSGAQIAQQLKNAFGDLTEAERAQALGRIFGNEQITAARILYSGGSAAVEEWTAAVDDSGYAAEQAAIRQDNLAGDIEKLGGAFDTALIKTGSGANDVLRDMVQIVTSLVDGYGELPSEFQQGALVIGVFTGAALLAAGATVGLRAKFIELTAQMDKTNFSLGRTAAIGGAVGIALAGAITVVALLAQKQAEARIKAEGYAQALESGGDAARKLALENLQVEKSLLWLNFGSAFDNAEKLGISLEDLASAATGSRKELEKVNDVLDVATGGGQAAAEMAERLGISQLDLAQSAGTLREQLAEETAALALGTKQREQANRAAEDAADANKTATDSYLESAGAVDDLQSSLSDLIDEIMDANNANLDTREANRRLIESFSDFDAALAENGATLDLNTEAGRENEANLDAIAQAAMESAKAITEGGGSYEEYRASLESSRQSLLDRINDLGITGQAAEDLADDILAIPSETEWKMVAETTEAATRIQRIQTAINNLRDKTINIVVNRPDGTALSDRQLANQFGIGMADGGNVQFFANGGRNEHHVAQFARAGDYRVWAEPETGGEWYLPDSPAKRQRSLMLAQQMLDGWGFQVIPKGAGSFANGGGPGGAVGAGGQFTGTLVLDSGAVVGLVRGVIAQSPKHVYDAVADEKNRRR